MIQIKEELQKNFPSFTLHPVQFPNCEFYLLINEDVSFHIDIDKSDGKCNVDVYKRSEKYGNIDTNKAELIDKLKEKYKELRQEHYD